MLNTIFKRHFPSVLSICLLAAIVFLLSGSTQQEGQLQETGQLSAYKVQGPMKVHYQYRTSDTGSTGTGNTPVEVEEILFFDRYVIVKSTQGTSRLIPIEKVMHMSWGSNP